jgi:hypothetical protein
VGLDDFAQDGDGVVGREVQFAVELGEDRGWGIGVLVRGVGVTMQFEGGGSCAVRLECCIGWYTGYSLLVDCNLVHRKVDNRNAHCPGKNALVDWLAYRSERIEWPVTFMSWRKILVC